MAAPERDPRKTKRARKYHATDEDYAAMQGAAKKAGTSLSTLIAQAVLRRKIGTPPHHTAHLLQRLEAAHAELHSIANSLTASDISVSNMASILERLAHIEGLLIKAIVPDPEPKDEP